MHEIPSLNWFKSELPPYGQLPTPFSPGTAPPLDWTGEDFAGWMAERLGLMNKILWPRCNWKEKQWEGAAVGSMTSLTGADLALLLEMGAPGPGRLLDAVPNSASRHLSCPPHRKFFEAEDEAKISDAPRYYDRDASEELRVDGFTALFWRGLSRKCPVSMVFWFKDQLQRPRPYQAALLLGKTLGCEPAKTALHPSMISGHCIQGMCGLMGFAERVTLDGRVLAANTWDAIRQFCVDFGDRRVMAGVHYPSDNLASWILALDLCDFAVAPAARKAVKEHVWAAITGRSAVYQKITELPVGQRAPFEPALRELRQREPK